MVLTELISNNAVAVLLTPIAFEIADAMGSMRGPSRSR
jgi:di/tricarboxylate transporter